MQQIFYIIIFFLFQTNLYSEDSHTKINLTPKEISFIKQHPQITLAGGYSFEPYLIQENDKSITGYDADIVKIINARTGLNIKFELGNWREIQEKAKNRLFDGLSTSGYGGSPFHY